MTFNTKVAIALKATNQKLEIAPTMSDEMVWAMINNIIKNLH